MKEVIKGGPGSVVVVDESIRVLEEGSEEQRW